MAASPMAGLDAAFAKHQSDDLRAKLIRAP
jgi:hypothetical protein